MQNVRNLIWMKYACPQNLIERSVNIISIYCLSSRGLLIYVGPIT